MASARMSPYLSFTGAAAEAMQHYRGVFGGTLTSQTFGEFGGMGEPADADLVMHAQLETDDGLVLMGSDLPMSMRDSESGRPRHPITLFGDDAARLRRWWDGLADGGTVLHPLEPAPWGDQYGQLTDRFGVTWMVNISGSSAG